MGHRVGDEFAVAGHPLSIPLLNIFTYKGQLLILPEQVTHTALYYNRDHAAGVLELA